MPNVIIHTVTDAIEALKTEASRVVVVAAPYGSGMSTAIRDVYPDCMTIIATVYDPSDDFMNVVIDGRVVAAKPIHAQPNKACTVLLEEADNLPTWANASFWHAVAPFDRVILRTGLNVPETLAQYPRITLTGIAP